MHRYHFIFWLEDLSPRQREFSKDNYYVKKPLVFNCISPMVKRVMQELRLLHASYKCFSRDDMYCKHSSLPVICSLSTLNLYLLDKGIPQNLCSRRCWTCLRSG